MEREDINKRVRFVISELYIRDFNKITEEQHLKNDLELDSLDIVEFAIELEKEFNVILDDKSVDKLRTVGETIDLIISELNSKKK